MRPLRLWRLIGVSAVAMLALTNWPAAQAQPVSACPLEVTDGAPLADAGLARLPILAATEPWEAGTVIEPMVLPGGRMWYTGGWANPGIGYAESADGIAWRKLGPVIEGGAQPEVAEVGDELRLFFTGMASHDLRLATSRDGRSWSVQPEPAIARPATVSRWGNRSIWREGSGWRMVQEGMVGCRWTMFDATSADGLRWTLGAELTGLQIVEGGMVGGPQVTATTGGYTLRYHAASRAGNLPTDIWQATSPDLRGWTRDPLPIVSHAAPWDQAADPQRVGDLLYFDVDDNVLRRGAIEAVRLASL